MVQYCVSTCGSVGKCSKVVCEAVVQRERKQSQLEWRTHSFTENALLALEQYIFSFACHEFDFCFVPLSLSAAAAHVYAGR